MSAGARQALACDELGITPKTYRRWLVGNEVLADQRPQVKKNPPQHKLTDEEKAMILQICNEPEYASLPPSQIVPKLADKGVYIASESSYYRVLHEHGQLHHRGRTKQPSKVKQPTTHIATSANQLWSWDISYCPTLTRGLFYYLYMVEDIFSRKIVGWEVHEQESGDLAAELMQRTVISERCFKQPLVLHSDNGAPMKSSTLLAKLYELGITPSRGRPRVSNDNPFSESLFKTMKYTAKWPAKGFANLTESRKWVQAFVHWYNEQHCHSGIKFVTPGQRHSNLDQSLLASRTEVYEQAKQRNPKRWSRNVRNWEYIDEVTLNPDKKVVKLRDVA